jgi:16S rRNA (guanine527-N7)-methyltransferase
MVPLTAAGLAGQLESCGITVGAGEAEALAGFVNLLEHWNRVHNLTGSKDRRELIERHLVESLALAPFVRGPDAADIGSGAGLPGLPLAIRLPDVQFTLIESRRKRISFLRQVVVTLRLGNVRVAHGRAESLELPSFATVLARAVAPPAELLALLTPLVKPDGRLVLLTSADKGEEIIALAPDYRLLEASPGQLRLRSRIVVLERTLC